MEIDSSQIKSRTEVTIGKPKTTENEFNNPALPDCSGTKNRNEINVDKEEVEESKETEKESGTINNVIASALPPPEMFEIRNSPPLPSAGNKKLKKLMERNKK